MTDLVALLESLHCRIGFEINEYNDSLLERTNLAEYKKQDSIRSSCGTWEVALEARPFAGRSEVTEVCVTFTLIDGNAEQCAPGIRLTFEQWSTDNHVHMPSAVYAGNRFQSRPLPYPPLLSDPADFSTDIPTIITDVPRLEIGAGRSRIQLLTRDLATPAVGIRFTKDNLGTWILTDQATRLGDTGIMMEESDDRTQASLSLRAPGVREGLRYGFGRICEPSPDRGADFKAGDAITLRFVLYTFSCADVPALFDKFMMIRKDLAGPATLRHELPFSETWKLLEEKHNRDNWRDAAGYYAVGTDENILCNRWQLGWVGGGMITHPLLWEGQPVSRERAWRNLEFMLGRSQAPSGFLYGTGDGERFYSDSFLKPHPHNMNLIRKNADAIYFILKQFNLIEKQGQKATLPTRWLETTKRLADSFVTMWERYGQFGQFVDSESGDILIGNSTSASTAPGGLALAAGYFGNPKYLEIAKASARMLYKRDVCAGITTGGPGEILQCPDSESAFGLLESFVVLYEVTGEREWIEMACDMANQCATWCVSYDFAFPPQSLFGRTDMKTTGSVWANVQNKHSAPSICTLSGDSLFKLYRATGNLLYLDLITDIAHGIPQYVSRPDRPVGQMPSGWITERVNLSDWAEGVGEIFEGSCWPEVSLMLTYVDIPGIYVQPDTGFVRTFDHVEVTAERRSDGLYLTIFNPTRFDAEVKLFVENATETTKPLGQNYLWGCRKILIPAGKLEEVHCG
jgi:hypothetical protein